MDNRFGAKGWGVVKEYFPCFNKHSISLINCLYLSHGAFNNKPTSRAEWKENWAQSSDKFCKFD